MDQQSALILLTLAPILVSLCVSAATGTYVFTRRHVPGARAFGIAVMLEVVATFGYLFELLSPNFAAKVFWDNLQWIPTTYITLAFLEFTVQYTGRKPLKTWVWVSLGSVLTIFMLLIFTPSLRGLLIDQEKYVPLQPFTVYEYHFRFYLLAFLLVHYIVMGWNLAILVQHALQNRGLIRRQTWFAVLGLFIPVFGTIVILLDLPLGPYRDVTPYVFILTNIFLGIGFSRFHVFDLIPYARTLVLLNMEDGAVVLDPQGVLVDFNPAARMLIGRPRMQPGKPLAEVCGECFNEVRMPVLEKSTNQEIELHNGGIPHTIAVQVTRLSQPRGEFSGYLLILRDVTEQKLARVVLEQSNAEMQQQVAERTAELTNAMQRMQAEIEERQTAERALERKVRQNMVLVELSSTLLVLMADYPQVLQLSVRRCAEIIGDGATIFLYHPGQDLMEMVACYNANAEQMRYFQEEMRSHPLRADEAAYALVIQSGQSKLYPTLDPQALVAQAPPERKEYYRKLPFYSAMFAPLLVEGACIGVLGIARHSPGQPAYTQEDLAFFTEVADLSAIAIWHARIMESLKNELAERNRVEEILRESEEKYRMLFASSGEAIVLMKDDVIIDVNESGVRMVKADREQILGDLMGTFAPEIQPDGEPSESKARRVMDTVQREGWHRSEWTFLLADGTLLETEITFNAITMRGEQLVQVTIHDVTAHKRAQDAIKQAYEATLEGWASALELRELETAHHSDRVVGLTLEIARCMGIGEEECLHIHRGALLHDIGKMGIPDSILLKPGKLTDEEWVVMRRHPDLARSLLSRIPYLNEALVIPYCHHERWDGSGYPQGLRGEEIPLPARIFAVVDVWDALTADRPYRKAWTKEATIRYIKENAGQLFDPEVVREFLRVTEAV